MNYLNTAKDDVMLGSGFLYALPYSQFEMGTVDSETGVISGSTSIDDMDEIGYIKDSATFTREHDSVDIESANYGLIETLVSKYTTTFETGIISYNSEKVSKYLTGHDVVKSTDGTEKSSFFCEPNVIPAVSLVFVGTDESTGKSIKLVMPKCKWEGAYAMEFNNDNPIELDYTFRCLNVTLPNGKIGAAYLTETTTATETA